MLSVWASLKFCRLVKGLKATEIYIRNLRQFLFVRVSRKVCQEATMTVARLYTCIPVHFYSSD